MKAIQQQRHWALDLCSMILVGALAFGICLVYLYALSDPLSHELLNLPSALYPAIFFAAGRGMGTADLELIPGLADFLYFGARSFDLSNIPADIEVVPITTSPELTHYYLFYAVGWAWRLFGVSVDSLLLLMALLHAVGACCLYALYRLMMSRPGSFVAVVLACTSPPMLYMSARLRDYGKAPFFMGLAFILVRLIVRPLSTPSLLALSAFAGVYLGIGFGFRQDLTLAFPLMLVFLLFFSTVESPRPYRARFAAILVFLLLFIPITRPVYRGMALENGKVGVNAFFFGLAPDVTSTMDVGGASYDMLGYSDEAPFAMVNAYARRSGYAGNMVNPHSSDHRRALGDATAPLVIDPFTYFISPEYAAYGKELARKYFITFPADFVSGAWRSTVAVYAMPVYKHQKLLQVEGDFPKWMQCVFGWGGVLSRHIKRFGLAYVFCALLWLSLRRFKLALYMTGLVLFFTGYVSLWFDYRHFFHLVFIPVGAMVLCADYSVRNFLFRCSRFSGWRRQGVATSARSQLCAEVFVRAVCFVLVLVAAVVVPLTVLRYWQVQQVHTVADQLEATCQEKWPVTTDILYDRVRIMPHETLPGLVGASDLPLDVTAWDYVAIVLDTHGRDIPVRIEYDNERGLHGFTQDVVVYGAHDACTGRVTLYFPVYESVTIYDPAHLKTYGDAGPEYPWYEMSVNPAFFNSLWKRMRFIGVSLPEAYLAHFVGMYHVRDPHGLDILPIFQLPDERQNLRPYKRGPWERCIQAKLCANTRVRNWSCCVPVVDPRRGPVKMRILAASQDEAFVRYQQPDDFHGPRLCFHDSDEYITEWTERIRYLPILKDSAAADLVRTAQVWRAEGRNQDAINLLRAALDLRDDMALYWLRLGTALYEEQAYSDALASISRAMLKEPFLPETAEKVAGIYKAWDDPSGHARFWGTIAQAHPDSWFVGMRLGEALEAAGAHKEAAEAYHTVSRYHPDQWDSVLAYSRCLRHLGDLDEARSALSEVLELAVSLRSVAAYEFIMLGQAYMEKRSYEEAVACFKIPLALGLHIASSYMHLGGAYGELEQWEAAVEAYREAVAHEPDNLWLRRLWGLAALCCDNEVAMEQLQFVLRSTPHDEEVARKLDRTLVRTHTHVGRLKIWESIKEDVPDAFLPLMYSGDAAADVSNRKAAMLYYQQAKQRLAPEWQHHHAYISERIDSLMRDDAAAQ